MRRKKSGILDRQGVEIREGDWVIADVGKISSHYNLQVAYHKYHGFMLMGSIGKYSLEEAKDMEIFGNIYESPTLSEALKNYKKGG